MFSGFLRILRLFAAKQTVGENHALFNHALFSNSEIYQSLFRVIEASRQIVEKSKFNNSSIRTGGGKI
jgi:hypothetical protein